MINVAWIHRGYGVVEEDGRCLIYGIVKGRMVFLASADDEEGAKKEIDRLINDLIGK